MLKQFQWEDGNPLVDIIDWDFNYFEDHSGFQKLQELWNNTFKTLKTKINIRANYSHQKIKSIHISNCYYIIDFKRFKYAKIEHFPNGNFDAFLSMACFLAGARIAEWMKVLKNDRDECIVGIDRNMAKLLFSVIVSSWKYRIAYELEKKSQTVEQLVNYLKSVKRKSVSLIEALENFNDLMFDRALGKVVPIKDTRREIAIYSENHAEQLTAMLDNFRNTNQKRTYITTLSLIPKMIDEIEKDISIIKDGRRGSVVDRIVGNAEMVLYSKGLLLIEQYGINRDMYNKEILIACVSELLRSFAFGKKPPLMGNDDEQEKLKEEKSHLISRVMKWRSELDEYVSRMDAEHENDQFFNDLQEVLRGPGPAWRAASTEKRG